VHEIVTVTVLATVLLVIVNVAAVAPAATVTLLGTVAADVLLLVSVTFAPPDGAGPFSVTVPVDKLPAAAVTGLSATELGTRAITVRTAVAVVLLYVHEIVALALLVTALLVTVNVAVVALAATVTLAGTVAAAVSLLLSATTVPPLGAGPLIVTVPVDVLPPVTEVGLSIKELGTGAFTVTLAVCVPLL
jgi:hypothetical protein